MTLTVLTPGLEIAYEAHGDPRGFPVVLLHGFPDDVRAWDEVAPALAAAGHRVLVPYLRGYGPTRFLDPAAPRMAQQAKRRWRRRSWCCWCGPGRRPSGRGDYSETRVLS